MLPTDLEFQVFSKFCKIMELAGPARANMIVRKRSRSDVGFFTDFELAGDYVDHRVAAGTYDNIPNAQVPESDELLGFLLFVSSGMIFTLEGHVYGEKWPKAEFPIEFLPRMRRAP